MYINLYRFFYYKLNIMSCTAPAPQNLNGPNFKPGKCRYKCEYKFSYPLTDLHVTSNNSLGFFNFKVDPEHT